MDRGVCHAEQSVLPVGCETCSVDLGVRAKGLEIYRAGLLFVSWTLKVVLWHWMLAPCNAELIQWNVITVTGN